MKLYIIGESSPDPEQWGEHGGWTLVAAESPEQAATFANVTDDRPITEVCLDHVRFFHPDPHSIFGELAAARAKSIGSVAL